MWQPIQRRFVGLLLSVGLISWFGAPFVGAAATDGAITGKVTDEQGNPLKDVAVTTYHKSAAGVWEFAPYTTRTDEQGIYTLSGLPANVYRVGFGLDYHFTSYRYRALYFGPAPTLKSAKDVDVPPGGTRSGINGRFVRYAGYLQGHVTDQRGQPIQGIEAKVFEDFDGDKQWELFVNSTTTVLDVTEESGNYGVADLPDGAYRLQFRQVARGVPGKYGCGDLAYVEEYYPDVATLAAAQNVTIKQGRGISDLNAQLADTGRIRGRITGVDGPPVAQVLVRSTFDLPEKPATCMETFTDDAGFYELRVPDATHYLNFLAVYFRGGIPIPFDAGYRSEYYNNVDSAAAATPIQLQNRATITGIDAELEPTGAILGTVTDRNGVGLDQIKAVAYSDPAGDGQWQPFHWSLSNAAGAYWVTNLPSGVYRLELQDTRQPPLFHSATFYHETVTFYLEEGADLIIAEEGGARTTAAVGQIQLMPYAEINAAPLAHSDAMLVFSTSVTSTFLSGYSVLDNDRDAEQNSLTATLVTSPTQGTLTLAASGFFTYTTITATLISDAFAYRASDGVRESAVVSVTISRGVGRNFLPVVVR